MYPILLFPTQGTYLALTRFPWNTTYHTATLTGASPDVISIVYLKVFVYKFYVSLIYLCRWKNILYKRRGVVVHNSTKTIDEIEVWKIRCLKWFAKNWSQHRYKLKYETVKMKRISCRISGSKNIFFYGSQFQVLPIGFDLPSMHQQTFLYGLTWEQVWRFLVSCLYLC